MVPAPRRPSVPASPVRPPAPPRPAARSHRESHVHMESTFTKTPGHFSVFSERLLGLRGARPSVPGRWQPARGGPGRRRGGVGGGGGWRCRSRGSGGAQAVLRFSQRDFPGASDISNLGASFPWLAGSAHGPISSGSRAGSGCGEVRRARAPRLAGAPSPGLALPADDRRPLPRRLPLPAGEDAAPLLRLLGSRGGGGAAPRPASLPILPGGSLS